MSRLSILLKGARTIQKWQRINFDSISDKYVTSMLFDEFIISYDLVASLFFKSRLIRRRNSISRCRFTVLILATFPQYIPPLFRGTLRILSKMLNVYILRRLFSVVLRHFKKVYCKKNPQTNSIEKKKHWRCLCFSNMQFVKPWISMSLHFQHTNSCC